MFDFNHTAIKAGLLVVVAAMGLSACAKKKEASKINAGIPSVRQCGGVRRIGCGPDRPQPGPIANPVPVSPNLNDFQKQGIASLQGIWETGCDSNGGEGYDGEYWGAKRRLEITGQSMRESFLYFSDLSCSTDAENFLTNDYTYSIPDEAQVNMNKPIDYSFTGDSTLTKDIFRVAKAPGGPDELYFGNNVPGPDGRPSDIDLNVKYIKGQ